MLFFVDMFFFFWGGVASISLNLCAFFSFWGGGLHVHLDI